MLWLSFTKSNVIWSLINQCRLQWHWFRYFNASWAQGQHELDIAIAMSWFSCYVYYSRSTVITSCLLMLRYLKSLWKRTLKYWKLTISELKSQISQTHFLLIILRGNRFHFKFFSRRFLYLFFFDSDRSSMRENVCLCVCPSVSLCSEWL